MNWMNNNYFFNDSDEARNYINGTYISKEINNSDYSKKYRGMLPPNLDILSEIDLNSLYLNCKIDKEKLGNFIFQLQSAIYDIFLTIDRNIVLPKMQASIDQDDAVVFNMTYENFRIFLSLEVDDGQSFYGMIYSNKSTGELESRSAALKEDEYYNTFILLIERLVDSING